MRSASKSSATSRSLEQGERVQFPELREGNSLNDDASHRRARRIAEIECKREKLRKLREERANRNR
ncbi:hypothetical protein JAAARDRAFT_34020 [Jaapia argillacea MUCL 33604]|uniref:Uncharacterized protein n=1 Tax=Jaapia argillacea MUCL 33604 TaxID=933084 RepID=A0A067Q9M3_9AGAM|nr:hypothetical protein JAAARDRAFT_34020 [Jaapia argillacea MUCL 33604]